MTKKDLKSGMVVETRDGERYLVVKNETKATYLGMKEKFIFIGSYTFMNCDAYDKNLLEFEKGEERDETADIVKVYEPKKIMALYHMTQYNNLNLLWEREE